MKEGHYMIKDSVRNWVVDQPGADLSKKPITYSDPHGGPNQTWLFKQLPGGKHEIVSILDMESRLGIDIDTEEVILGSRMNLILNLSGPWFLVANV